MKPLPLLILVMILATTITAGCIGDGPADRISYTDKPPLIGTNPTDYFSISVPLKFTLDAQGSNTRDGTTWTHRSQYTLSVESLTPQKTNSYGDVAPDADANTLALSTHEIATSQPQACNGQPYAGLGDNRTWELNPVFRDKAGLDSGDLRPFAKLTGYRDSFQANNIYTFIPIVITIHLTINDGPEIASWNIALPIPIHMPPPGETIHEEQEVNLHLFTPFKTLLAHLTDVSIQGSTRTGWAWVKTENKNILDDWGLIGRFINFFPVRSALIEIVYDGYKWFDVPEGGSEHNFNTPRLTGSETFYYKIRG